MSIDLSNRVCIVTGAGRGIGEGIARGFAKRGATVVATDVKPPDYDCALALAWDVADPQAATRVVEQVLAKFGKVDAFIANAGIYPQQNWADVSLDDWRKVLAINLDGAWYGAQAVSKPMTEAGYGKIVLVSSVEVVMGVGHHTHYSSAKAGLIGLTRSLSRAVGKDGVRVNCVFPGAVQTPGELEQFPDQEAVAKVVDDRQCVPGRITPAMIEPTFAFLCSAESDVITGQVIVADHGLVHW